MHLGDFECRAGALPRDVSRVSAGPHRRDATTRQIDRATNGGLASRDEPDAGQIRIEPPGVHVAESPATIGRIGRTVSRHSPSGPGTNPPGASRLHDRNTRNCKIAGDRGFGRLTNLQIDA